MRRASAKRTRSRAAGPSVGRVLLRRTTRGRRRPIFSAPSAPPKGKALGLSCPPATARPWLCISRKSRLQSPQAHMPSFSSIRRDGMSRRSCPYQATSRSCRCRRNHPSSTPSKTSGNYARQLALKPHLQSLRRHFGPLLFCLKQTHRHALENNVHRHARLGSSVIISETRYKNIEPAGCAFGARLFLYILVSYALSCSAKDRTIMG